MPNRSDFHLVEWQPPFHPVIKVISDTNLIFQTGTRKPSPKIKPGSSTQQLHRVSFSKRVFSRSICCIRLRSTVSSATWHSIGQGKVCHLRLDPSKNKATVLQDKGLQKGFSAAHSAKCFLGKVRGHTHEQWLGETWKQHMYCRSAVPGQGQDPKS